MYDFTTWIKLLTESKQSIIGFGFPEVIAKLFYEKFGNKATLIARWFKENYDRENNPNWWKWMFGGYNRSLSLDDYCKLYKATFDPEEYIRVRKQLDLSDNPVDEIHLRESREILKKQIEDKLFNDYFFSHALIKDIISGKIIDLSPYKNLNFHEAWQKYENKVIFSDKKLIKSYKNGFKWIDVGKRCPLVGHEMRNCGSAGLMSWDSDATMVTLFGPENKPHVVVTYSPNEKRISGAEGGASTAVKTKYHRYVIDLSEILGAEFDYGKSKSDLLGVKYQLRDKAKNIQQLRTKAYGDSVFRFTVDGVTYYSNRYVALPANVYTKIKQAVESGEITLPIMTKKISDLFNYRNQDILKHYGIQYIPLNNIGQM